MEDFIVTPCMHSKGRVIDVCVCVCELLDTFVDCFHETVVEK